MMRSEEMDSGASRVPSLPEAIAAIQAALGYDVRCEITEDRAQLVIGSLRFEIDDCQPASGEHVDEAVEAFFNSAVWLAGNLIGEENSLQVARP